QWKSGGKSAQGPEDELARAEQIEQMRNFCTKLWNISKFVLMSLGEKPPALVPLDEFAAFSGCRLNAGAGEMPRSDRNAELELAARWILSRFAAASAVVNDAVDRYDL